MMSKTELSKFLSYVLRHRPESIGIELDKNGWTSISALLEKSTNGLTKELMYEIVKEDSKQRYAISEDGLQIRANQGHSVEVNLELKEKIPPVTLYHGTSLTTVDTILRQGLKKMKRHHVHLSDTYEKAFEVGKRRGKCSVLTIDTRNMVRRNIKFYISENGVWLTDFIDSEYISIST